MNENLNLVEILKDCPKGTKLYSSLYGEIEFEEINNNNAYPIITLYKGCPTPFTKEGKVSIATNGECTLFPSKEQRDWSNFRASWYQKNKFNPNMLQPFDKVLVRDIYSQRWTCGLFSHIVIIDNIYRYSVGLVNYSMCIPYNDDTKHLVGTKDQAPEYYRYWED